MADEEKPWYEQLLDLQLRANPAIWKHMRKLGVDGDTQLRLGFTYLAPGEPEAQRLAAFLGERTDYEVQVRARPGTRSKQQEWLVLGATQPTTVTPETIDAWVEWMVAAGAAEGPCAFDGWTSEILNAAVETPDP
jgi:hypothetical protein